MAGEDLRRGALFRRLPGYGLGAVLAELEGRGVFRVGPGATRTIEAVGLVFAQQGFAGRYSVHLRAHSLGDGLQRPPTAGGRVIIANAFCIVVIVHAGIIGHRRDDGKTLTIRC